MTARLRSIWIWGASAVLVSLWTLLLALVRLTDGDPMRRRTARWFRRLGRVLAKVNPWRVEVNGRAAIERGRPYVVVSNHQSLADIPLISHLHELDTKWLAKAELFRVPFVGWMMRLAGDVPVRRGDAREGARALLECARYLRGGCSVVFFPEGTRSKDGHLLPFSDGPFRLAIREKADVLPLVVEGSGGALPRRSWIFGPVQTVRLTVLSPVVTAGRKPAEAEKLREEVRALIAGELNRLRGVAHHH